ncbi:MAG: hypothetical protein DMG76_00540 [Acidobacteria bacterium]|nr:MAG: hypothetical protein DMG76_00540 [Acidobacteriota bacterium]
MQLFGRAPFFADEVNRQQETRLLCQHRKSPRFGQCDLPIGGVKNATPDPGSSNDQQEVLPRQATP